MPRLNLGIKDPNERIDDVLPYSADVTRIIYSTLKQKKALVFGNKDNGIVILSHSQLYLMSSIIITPFPRD